MRREDYEAASPRIDRSRQGDIIEVAAAKAIRVVVSRPQGGERCVMLLLKTEPMDTGFQFDKETLDAIIADLIAARNTVWPTP